MSVILCCMKKMPIEKLIALILMAFFVIACEPAGDNAPVDGAESIEVTEAGHDNSAALNVYAVNYPLQFFTETIAGTAVTAVFPAPVGENPAEWLPDIDTVIAYQQADLVVLNGSGYAKWLRRYSLPLATRVDTTAAISDRLLPLQGKKHTHGPGGEHVHEVMAGGTWLDPQLAMAQAEAIHARLVKEVPSATTDFDAGLHELRKVLDDLDSRFAAAFSALKSRKLCFSTGDYAYLNAHYELEGSYVPLAEANVAQAVRLLREANCEQLFTQSGTDTALTGSLAEAGIDWQVFDTGAAKPAAGNYVDVMEANLDRLRK